MVLTYFYEFFLDPLFCSNKYKKLTGRIPNTRQTVTVSFSTYQRVRTWYEHGVVGKSTNLNTWDAFEDGVMAFFGVLC